MNKEKLENIYPKEYQFQGGTESCENWGDLTHACLKILSVVKFNNCNRKSMIAPVWSINFTQKLNMAEIYLQINIKVNMNKIVFLDQWHHHFHPFVINYQKK